MTGEQPDDEANDPQTVSLSGTITPDNWVASKGQTIKISGVLMPPSAISQSADMRPPNHVDGAFLLVALWVGETSHVWGSAALVAPSVAVAAAHVIQAMVEHRDAVGGPSQIFAIGVGQNSLDIWNVENIRGREGYDVVLMEMNLGKPDYGSVEFRVFEPTTRLPKVGDPILMLGFVADNHEVIIPDGDAPVINMGKHYASIGQVTATYPQGRDKVMLPGSCIEVAADTLRGMSGGPAFDKDGHLVGLITSGLESENGTGPTFISLLWQALILDAQPKWPPNLHPADASRLLDSRLAFVHDRWRLVPDAGGEGVQCFDAPTAPLGKDVTLPPSSDRAPAASRHSFGMAPVSADNPVGDQLCCFDAPMCKKGKHRSP